MELPFEGNSLTRAYECALVVNELKNKGIDIVDLKAYESLLEAYILAIKQNEALFDEYNRLKDSHASKDSLLARLVCNMKDNQTK